MGLIGNIIYGVMSNKEKVERCQKHIREAEWEEIKEYIKPNSSFIDVGCGAGYTLKKVIDVYNCDGIGMDPAPGEHGVGRYSEEKQKSEKIIKGSAENIPFGNSEFDIVYSSHVLEHVNNEMKSLSEMNRILKGDGILILGVPTALMAWIALFSQLIFTTHIRIYNFIRHFFSTQIIKNLVQIFFYKSHSYPRAKTIFYDLLHYRKSNWIKIISKNFEIIKIIEPCLYPFPDYPQWFKLKKSKLGSSSIFFICRKRIS